MHYLRVSALNYPLTPVLSFPGVMYSRHMIDQNISLPMRTPLLVLILYFILQGNSSLCNMMTVTFNLIGVQLYRSNSL